MIEKCRIDVPTNGPILPSILEAVSSVYQHYDLANTPLNIDEWPWHDFITISYGISKWDPLSLVTATLCIYEDGRTHFEIDLVFPCIRDQFTLKQYRTPPDVLDLLGELRCYINNILVHRRTTREAAYYQQLVKSNLLSQHEYNRYWMKEPDSGWGGTCPACFDAETGKGYGIIACVVCEKLGCANSKCHGYDIHGIAQSVSNVGETYCRSCNGEGENAMLIRCSKCRSKWFNPRCHPRCVGRPEPLEAICVPGRSKDNRQKSSFQRLESKHPPITAPCDECQREDTGGWLSCSNILCWSQNGVVCRACSPKGGEKCPKRHTWTCDVCVSHRETFEHGDAHQMESEDQIWLDADNVWGV